MRILLGFWTRGPSKPREGGLRDFIGGGGGGEGGGGGGEVWGGGVGEGVWEGHEHATPNKEDDEGWRTMKVGIGPA